MYNVANEWETQAAFFKYNNITPKWFNANYTWGTLNETTGEWSGAVGMIQRDEVDYALWGFGGTYGRSKVAAFSPGIEYSPYYWLTRYPQELPPTWNLLGLFTKGYNSQLSSQAKPYSYFKTRETINFKQTDTFCDFFYVGCLDVDILLLNTCMRVTISIFKVLQENVSRNEVSFN